MQGKLALAALVAGPMAFLWPSNASAYLPHSTVVLERVASRRADLAFRTVVSDGYLDTDAGPVPIWMALRAGRALRIEVRKPEGTEVELRVGRDLYRITPGATSNPERLRADPFLELLGDVRKDPGGRRGLALLARMGIDPEVLTLARFDGRPVFVIGAAPGELDRPQLWIDKQYLVPSRWLLPDGTGRLEDVRLTGYHVPTAGPWFPERMERWRGEQLLQRVTFTRAKLNARVEPRLFSPAPR
ncbi:MAG: hypothetical protein AAFU79_20245 [Myxococcota bacterium]